MLSWKNFMTYWGSFYMYFEHSIDADGCPGRYIAVYTERFLKTKLLEWMIFPTILATVFAKAVGRYMTKFLAVKTTYNRLYIVFTIKM